ncbi:MAG: hypothetical protein P8X42_06990, partial [Calditrichaceae bacterium]
MSFNFIPEKTVEIPDIEFKENIRLPADSAALLVIDMQNDFIKDMGTLRVLSARETIPNNQKLLKT